MAKKWLRRTAAMLLAAAALVTTAAGAEQKNPCRDSAACWLLQWELGNWSSIRLSIPTLLALSQSPALLSARVQVMANLENAVQSEAELPASQEPASQAVSDIAGDTAAAQPLSLPELTFPDNGVPSQTVRITNPAGYTVVRGVYIKNASNKTLDAQALSAENAGWAVWQREAA